MRQVERIVLTDGRIYTPDGAVCSAVIEDGRLAWLGGEVPPHMLDGSRVIRLDGRAVLPGFSDSCAHLMRWAASHEQIRLDDCASPDDIKSVLRDFADMHPEPAGGCYQGYGWSCAEPLRSDIDAVVSDVPVVLRRRGGRAAAVNTAALIAAGITRDTRIEAGEVRLGPDGEPDGILIESAASLVLRCVRQASDSELLRMLKTYAPRAAACGITEICTDDAESFGGDYSRMISFYMNAAERGELPFRVRLSFRVSNSEELRSFLALGWRTGEGLPMCRIGAVRIVCDGAAGDGRALCSDTVRYADIGGFAAWRGSSGSGMALIGQAELDEMLTTARMSGMQAELQADGDNALDMCLNALERTASRRPAGMRDVIITSGMADDAQIDRMKKLRVSAAVCPHFTLHDMKQAVIGADAVRRMGRWRSIASRGIIVSSGSGAPDGDINPFRAVNAAMTRIPGSDDTSWGMSNTECLTPHEAFAMYAWNAAWNGRCEARRGEIAPGRDADLVVLSEDPFSCADTSELRAEMVICAGRVTYSSGKIFQTGD